MLPMEQGFGWITVKFFQNEGGRESDVPRYEMHGLLGKVSGRARSLDWDFVSVFAEVGAFGNEDMGKGWRS